MSRLVGALTLALAIALAAAGCGSSGDASTLTERQVVDRASPSTVYTTSKVAGDAVAGTGVVYDAAQGLVLTSAHSVWGASEIEVLTSNGLAAHAVIAARDGCDDLAVLALHPRLAGLISVSLATNHDLHAGDHVTALGYVPGGSPSKPVLSATEGAVSAVGISFRPDMHFPALSSLVQHQAPVAPSSSGGPLLNDRGELIGLNVSLPTDKSRASYATSSEQLTRRLGKNFRRGARGFYSKRNSRSQCHHDLEAFTHELHPRYKPGGHGHAAPHMRHM
jgi:S1-C subfamily serine protease